jgi:hypothetical protein
MLGSQRFGRGNDCQDLSTSRAGRRVTLDPVSFDALQPAVHKRRQQLGIRTGLASDRLP